MSKPEFDYRVLPEAGRELLETYKRAMDNLNDEIARIQREAQEEANRVHVAHLEELKQLWYQMAPMVGLDAQATWDSNEWGVDTRYLEAGFGALTHVPMTWGSNVRPSGGMHQPVPDEDEGSGPPPGTKLN